MQQVGPTDEEARAPIARRQEVLAIAAAAIVSNPHRHAVISLRLHAAALVSPAHVALAAVGDRGTRSGSDHGCRRSAAAGLREGDQRRNSSEDDSDANDRLQGVEQHVELLTLLRIGQSTTSCVEIGLSDLRNATWHWTEAAHLASQLIMRIHQQPDNQRLQSRGALRRGHAVHDLALSVHNPLLKVPADVAGLLRFQPLEQLVLLRAVDVDLVENVELDAARAAELFDLQRGAGLL